MVDYWLDSNVYIEGRKGPYGFDIAPRFWNILDELIDNDRISCPMPVYYELQDGQDDLSTWAKERRRDTGLFVEPSEAVQRAFRRVAKYVTQRYPDNQARRRFLDRADPWVIAHAIAQGGSVVTLEGKASDASQQVKIPNVCSHFNVTWIDTYEMLRELGESWNS